jgi:type IV secretory pathway TrbD component
MAADRRTGYRAGVIAGASLLVSQYVFDIDFGPFVWAIALMTVGFAAAFVTTPAD